MLNEFIIKLCNNHHSKQYFIFWAGIDSIHLPIKKLTVVFKEKHTSCLLASYFPTAWLSTFIFFFSFLSFFPKIRFMNHLQREKLFCNVFFISPFWWFILTQMLSSNSAGASEAQLDLKFLEHEFFSNSRKLSELVSPLSYSFSEKVSMAPSLGQNS